jgi:WD40 repeat protein
MIVLKGLRERLDGLVLSQDGRVAACAGFDTIVYLWDLVADSRIPITEDIAAYDRNGYDISPNGRLLVVVSYGNLTVYDIASGQATATVAFERHIRSVQTVRFLSNTRLLTGTLRWGKGDAQLTTFDIAGRKLGPGKLLTDNAGAVNALALTPDRRTLVTHADQQLDVWDMRTRKQRTHWEQKSERDRMVAISPDGTLVVAFERTRLQVLDVTGGDRGATFQQSGRKQYQGAAFTPDGRTLAAVGGSDIVRLWDTTTWKERHALDWGVGELRGIAFTADGLRGVAVSGIGRIVVWDL